MYLYTGTVLLPPVVKTGTRVLWGMLNMLEANLDQIKDSGCFTHGGQVEASRQEPTQVE